MDDSQTDGPDIVIFRGSFWFLLTILSLSLPIYLYIYVRTYKVIFLYSSFYIYVLNLSLRKPTCQPMI